MEVKYQVFHMRNETSFDECRETVSPRTQPAISLDKLQDACLSIWASSEWHKDTDWIEIYPVQDGV